MARSNSTGLLQAQDVGGAVHTVSTTTASSGATSPVDLGITHDEVIARRGALPAKKFKPGNLSDLTCRGVSAWSRPEQAKQFVLIYGIRWLVLGHMESLSDQKRENVEFLLSGFDDELPVLNLFSTKASTLLQESGNARDVLHIFLGDLYPAVMKDAKEVSSTTEGSSEPEDDESSIRKMLNSGTKVSQWLDKLKGAGAVHAYALHLVKAVHPPFKYPLKRSRPDDDSGFPQTPTDRPGSSKAQKSFRT